MDRLPQFTTGLIVICIVVALGSKLGENIGALRPFFISEYTRGLPEVMSGEVWRLITPIFIHFGVLHIIFNMLWLWDLGGTVERTQGVGHLVALVLVSGVVGNLAQYAFSGPAFGGMSGVVFALLGYVWMQSRYNPWAGMFLHKEIVAMMLVWFLLGWTGLIGNIANMAHTGGLVVGVAWGYTAARLLRR